MHGANCQLTQRDGDGPEADAIALFTSTSGRCASNGGFLNGRRASTAGFRKLQVKPQSRDCGLFNSKVNARIHRLYNMSCRHTHTHTDCSTWATKLIGKNPLSLVVTESCTAWFRPDRTKVCENETLTLSQPNLERTRSSRTVHTSAK